MIVLQNVIRGRGRLGDDHVDGWPRCSGGSARLTAVPGGRSFATEPPLALDKCEQTCYNCIHANFLARVLVAGAIEGLQHSEQTVLVLAVTLVLVTLAAAIWHPRGPAVDQEKGGGAMDKCARNRHHATKLRAGLMEQQPLCGCFARDLVASECGLALGSGFRRWKHRAAMRYTQEADLCIPHTVQVRGYGRCCNRGEPLKSSAFSNPLRECLEGT